MSKEELPVIGGKRCTTCGRYFDCTAWHLENCIMTCGKCNVPTKDFIIRAERSVVRAHGRTLISVLDKKDGKIKIWTPPESVVDQCARIIRDLPPLPWYKRFLCWVLRRKPYHGVEISVTKTGEGIHSKYNVRLMT